MTDLERVETLLALLLLQQLKSVPQSEKALYLNIAGFSNVEIANILQITPQLVSDALYAARKRPRRSRSRHKK